jgi:hypothetical protein
MKEVYGDMLRSETTDATKFVRQAVLLEAGESVKA